MKLKLLGKVLVSTLIPVTLGIVALIFIGSSFASRGLYSMADIQLLEFAKKQASEIENIIGNVVSLTDMLDGDADIEAIAALAKEYGNTKESAPEFLAAQSTTNDILAELIEDFPDIASAIIIDLNGKSIAHSNPARIGTEYTTYPSYIEALKGTHIVVDTMTSRITGKVTAMIGSGITDDSSDDAVDAVLLLVVDLATVSEKTIQDLVLMPTSNPFLIDGDGVVLMERAFPELIGTDNSSEEFAKTMLAVRTGITQYEWEGVPKTLHFAELPSLNWVLGIETDEADFYITSNQIQIALAFAGILILLAVAAVIYVIIKRVVGSVTDNAMIASYVADGNLSLTKTQEQQLDKAIARNDEISTLSIALRTMIQNLSKMVFASEEKSKEAQIAADNAAIASRAAENSAREAEEKRQSILEAVAKLEDIVNNIASASEQLSKQIEDSTSGAQEQSLRMAETAHAMEQMNETVLDVARNSGMSAEIAENTKSKANDGASITQKCQASMNEVKSESMVLRQNMSELAGHTDSISAVMSVITDIADQTNLLALNAAIEAARAGEAGRGFAVVADEVRKLAEKTIVSTSDVANVILAIQQSTKVNVAQVDSAVERIETATELTVEGGQALDVILEMAVQSADGIRAIATASEEQSSTSNEIARSIAVVSDIANSTVQAMNEASIAVNSLSEQTQQLSRLVDSLKNS